MKIHESAVISETAQLGEGCEIGPFCVIEEGVRLGEGCRLHSHVVVHGKTEIGKENEFFPFSAIGIKSQDLKYAGEPTYLEIGDRNVFRENVTIHRGTVAEIPTRIGNDNLFLAYSHVAHDCHLGDQNILSNSAALAGHVELGDHVIVSGLSGIHQFCRVGDHAIVGGMTKIVQDVPPYMIADGNPAALRGVNKVGLERRGFSPEDIRALVAAYKKLFLKKDGNLGKILEEMRSVLEENEHSRRLVSFLDNTARGVVR